MATMESKLDRLIDTLNTCLPTLLNQTNGKEKSPPPPADPGYLSGNFPTILDREKLTFDTLPPPRVLESLIDIFFLRAHNQPYSFFNENKFRRKLAENLLPDYLIFAVLVSALRFSNDPYFNNVRHEAATGYARESWKHLVSTWFAPESDPNIHICQAITLLSIFDYTAGRRHPAWLKIGLSIRIAQDLRLMVEPDVGLSFIEQEEHRRTFWSIYVLDRLCSCGRNRPASIIDAHCRVRLPCGEENFRNGEWEETLTLEQAFGLGRNPAANVGPLALVVLTASILGRCAQHSIHEQSREESRLPPWDSKSEFAAIYSILLQLETQFEMGSRINKVLAEDCLRDGAIDMQIAGPFVFSHALFHTAQCLLHHPFLLYNQLRARGVKAPASFLGRAFQTCRENANSISTLINDTNNAGYPVYFSFMGYCAVVTTGIHMLYLRDDDIALRQQAFSCFQSGMAYLEEFSKYWKNGKTMLAILQVAANQAALCNSLMSNSSSLEEVDSQEIENMWAALDYSCMSQITELNVPFANASPSYPSWSSIFGMRGINMTPSTDANNFDPMNFFPISNSISNGESQDNPISFGDIASMHSFFGTTPLNF
ncbi:fungal-specific transcription factor domain-containing protein [Halenospora varia]|nr:fungal-specific transcription factor domain-containing protein [Halenospora varia]